MATGRPFDLRAERINRGLSITALAGELGIAFTTIYRVERGGRPQAPTMLAIARWLDTTPAELWPLDEDEPAVA